MAFNLGFAFGVALSTAALLAFMAVRNSRSGWRRERSSVVFETLLSWAQARAEMRRERQQNIESPSIALADQLSALSAALNANAGSSPRPADTTQPIEPERVMRGR